MPEFRDKTLVELLTRAERVGRGGLRFLDRHENAEWIGWPTVAARAQSTAGRIVALGVEPGERIALILRTSPEFFDAMFGILLAGGVPVPVYPPVRLGRLDEYHTRTAAMLDAASAKWVLTDSTLGGLLGETVAGTRNSRLLSMNQLPKADALTEPRQVHPDSFALVQFSSGTTVAPKPVALSHRAILAQVAALNLHWADIEEPSGVSWLPLYHDMGLIGCVFPALDVGAELTLIPPELFIGQPSLWLRALSKYRGTVSPAPNFAYNLCTERIDDTELEGVDLSYWRVALNGAESVSAEVLRRFIERFEPYGFRPEALSPVYGLSEASLAVTFSDLQRPFRSQIFDSDDLTRRGVATPAAQGTELVSVGKPLSGFKIELRDKKTGELCAPNRIGQLWITGPSLMTEYLGRPDATSKAIRDGWLDTGDEGFLFDGELFLAGRSKDIIILRGRNYAPEDIERSLDALQEVRTGCSVAVSHRSDRVGSNGESASGHFGSRQLGSEQLLIFTETRAAASEHTALEKRCRDRVLNQTGLEPSAIYLLRPGTLPRTSSGKLKRQATLKQHLAGTLKPPARVTPWHMIRAAARSRWAVWKKARSREHPDHAR